MNKSFDLKGELTAAARQCGLLSEESRAAPIFFQYIRPGDGRRGHLSTPWAFSLGKADPGGAQTAAASIAAHDPAWEAQNGYINITLTDEQISCVVTKLAADFRSRTPRLFPLEDTDDRFLFYYCINLAGSGAFSDGPVGRFDGLGPAIVSGALGGSAFLLAEEVYRFFRCRYGAAGSGLLLAAAAEIFMRRLDETV